MVVVIITEYSWGFEEGVNLQVRGLIIKGILFKIGLER